MTSFHHPHADMPDGDLHKAAKRGDLPTVQTLIAYGVELDSPGKDGHTALICAARKGHLLVVKALVAAGADMCATDDLGVTPLLYATAGAHTHVVKALLARGANANETTEFGTALHEAASKGNVELVDELLAHGADVHCNDDNNDTPLHSAAGSNEETVAFRLWRAGADPLKQNSKKQTALSLLPEHSKVAEMMRTEPHLGRSLPSAQIAQLHQRFTYLASGSYSGEQTVTAQDAIPELQRALMDAGTPSHEDDVEEVVMEQMDKSKCILGLAGVIKSFYQLQTKYQQPRELRVRFKNATRSKTVLRTKLAKHLLRAHVNESGSDTWSWPTPTSPTKSRFKWNEACVDALLAHHSQKRNGVDEESFVKVGMKVLFPNK